jgi:dTDP-4-dehydrorhamnose 3,5-epimerase
MSSIEVTPTKLDGVLVLKPKAFRDSRGFFLETYNQREFEHIGIRDAFIQDNQSQSGCGVLRGLHYQVAPAAQVKLIRVIRGEIFDVVADIRKNASTFGQWFGITLSEDNQKMLYIPKGFAHGYMAMKDKTEVLYKVDAFYSPEHERGILWKDPQIGVSWPDIGSEPLVSEKDQKNPTLEAAQI